MTVPDGYTEEQVVQIMQDVCRRVAWKFKFGYHDVNDMIQQGVLEILSPDKSGKTVLDKYDGKSPLSNFLYVHVRNRLFNYKRDNYMRPYMPCEKCPLNESIDSEGNCSKYKELLDDCEVFFAWSSRNISRRNIMNTLGLDQINDYNEDSMKYILDVDKEIDVSEVLDLIEEKLPVSYREDYTCLKYGHKLSKGRTEKLRIAILNILDGNEGEPDENLTIDDFEDIDDRF